MLIKTVKKDASVVDVTTIRTP